MTICLTDVLTITRCKQWIRGCWSFIDQLFTRSHMVCIFLIFRDPVCVLTRDVKNRLLELYIWRDICCHMMGRKYSSQWHYHILYTILLQCIYKKIQVFLIVSFQSGFFQVMNVSCNTFNARELFLQSWDQVTYLSPHSLSVNLGEVENALGTSVLKKWYHAKNLFFFYFVLNIRCSQCDMLFMTKHNSKRHEQRAHNRPFKVSYQLIFFLNVWEHVI